MLAHLAGASAAAAWSCDDMPQEGLMFCEDWASGLRHDRWTHEIGAHGGGNSEFQIYSAHPRNSRVRNGTLHIKPSFTYNSLGDLRGDLDIYPMGCTNDWNRGCRNQGSLHAESGNQGGKYWASQNLRKEDMPALRALIAKEGLPACEEKNGVCNHMVPVGGLRKSPMMSAKLKSTMSYRYGRLEFVATLPKGDYLWPALWMLPASQLPWPTAGEIDVMESMGNARNHDNTPNPDFALDHKSTSAALHLGTGGSWYDLAYTPAFEELKKAPFGTLANRRELSDGPHTFGCYWSEDNIYMYVDDDQNRVLDMDEMFRLKAQAVLEHPRHDIDAPIDSEERQTLAKRVKELGYKAGWVDYLRMNNREIPEYLWRESPAAPFDQPFYLIMNLAVGGDFFKGNLNPMSRESAMFDVPLSHSGQLPSMYWYSRMKAWWSSWSKPDVALPAPFANAKLSRAAFLEPRNTWSEYAGGAQDAGREKAHKADTLARVAPPPDEAIADTAALKVHRVSVYAVKDSWMCSGSAGATCRQHGATEVCKE